MSDAEQRQNDRYQDQAMGEPDAEEPVDPAHLANELRSMVRELRKDAVWYSDRNRFASAAEARKRATHLAWIAGQLDTLKEQLGGN